MRRAGKPDEAVRALQGAIAADDGKPTAALLSELALAQNAAGDGAAAKASLQQALTLDEKSASTHYLLGSVLAGDGDLQGCRGALSALHCTRSTRRARCACEAEARPHQAVSEEVIRGSSGSHPRGGPHALGDFLLATWSRRTLAR